MSWHNESRRHSLASRGIKTKHPEKTPVHPLEVQARDYWLVTPKEQYMYAGNAFLLPNGEFLDMIKDDEYYEHGDVTKAFNNDDENYIPFLKDAGAIRYGLTEHFLYIEVYKKPTPEQAQMLAKIVREKNPTYLSVDGLVEYDLEDPRPIDIQRLVSKYE